MCVDRTATLGGGSTATDLAAVWRAHFPYLPQDGPPGAEGLTYSFKRKEILFIAIDNYLSPTGDPVTPADFPWLDAELGSSNALHSIVLGHAPAFPATDSTWPTVHKALPSPGATIDPVAQGQRDAFWNVLGANGVRTFFTAHEHYYARGVALDDMGNDRKMSASRVAGCSAR